MKSEYLCIGIESTAHTFGVSVMDSEGKILSDLKNVYKPPAGSVDDLTDKLSRRKII